MIDKQARLRVLSMFATEQQLSDERTRLEQIYGTHANPKAQLLWDTALTLTLTDGDMWGLEAVESFYSYLVPLAQ